MVHVTKIQYSGSFNNGKKDRIFTEKVLFDEGIDRYSEWTVSLDYNDDKCSTGTFTGIFGFIMDETTYKFDQLDTCTFQFVVDKASELWEEEDRKKLPLPTKDKKIPRPQHQRFLVQDHYK